jgi:acyl carrier protein 2
MALEEEFDLEIPDSDAEKVVTVGDVVEYIKDNV